MNGPSLREFLGGPRARIGAGLATVAVALGVGAGLASTRPIPPQRACATTDPNTGCGPISLATVGHWLDARQSIEELNRTICVPDSPGPIEGAPNVEVATEDGHRDVIDLPVSGIIHARPQAKSRSGEGDR